MKKRIIVCVATVLCTYSICVGNFFHKMGPGDRLSPLVIDTQSEKGLVRFTVTCPDRYPMPSGNITIRDADKNDVFGSSLSFSKRDKYWIAIFVVAPEYVESSEGIVSVQVRKAHDGYGHFKFDFLPFAQTFLDDPQRSNTAQPPDSGDKQ